MRYRMLVLAAIIMGMHPGASFAEKVWTSFTPSDAVYDIAVQGDYIWCATANGPVRWDKRDMSYEVFHRIADNRVNKVVVDTDGNVWFGGPAGVHRWDGTSWSKYSTENGLPYAEVTALSAGPESGVWVGTWKLIPAYMLILNFAVSWSAGQEWVTPLNSEVHDVTILGPIWSFAVISANDVWAIGNYDQNHLIHFNGVSWDDITETGNAPFQKVSHVTVGVNHEILVTAGENVYHLKGGIWSLSFSESAEISAIAVSPGGDVYTALTQSDGSVEIRCFDGIQHTSYSLGKGWDLSVNVLRVDSDNTVWAGTPRGLFHYRAGYWTRLTPSNRLPNIDIRSLTVSVSGDVWVGTLQGAIRYSDGIWKQYSMADGLPDSTITALAGAPNGSVWFGTKNGISRYKGNIWKSYGADDGLGPSEGIQSILVDSAGNPWAQTESGIYRFLGDTWVSVDISNLTGLYLPVWTVDTSGDIWLGGSEEKYTDQGREIYWIIKSHSQSITWKETLSVGYGRRMNFLYPAPNGVFWAGVSINSGTDNSPSWSSSLYRISGDTVERKGSWSGLISTQPIVQEDMLWFGMKPSRDNDLGYLGGGLIAYDLHRNSSTQYSTEEGLWYNAVSALTLTPDGTVWVGIISYLYGIPGGLTRYGESLAPIITSVSDTAPKHLPFLHNYPNPFNPSTTISFTLPAHGKARLTVYDITGRKVRTLLNGPMTAGTHSIVWDGRDDLGKPVSSGVYVSRITAGKNTAVGKMLFLK